MTRISQSTLNLILDYGREYAIAPLPDDIKIGRSGFCYDNCFKQATGKYRYVEGIAIDTNHHGHPTLPKRTLHAWLTDGIHVFDPTWCSKQDEQSDEYSYWPPMRYIGIEIPKKYMKLWRSEVSNSIIGYGSDNPTMFKQFVRYLEGERYKEYRDICESAKFTRKTP